MAAAARRRPPRGPARRHRAGRARCRRAAAGPRGPGRSAGLASRLPNVTVRSARTASPSTAPVSASTPLGTSTATTQPSAAFALVASAAASSRSGPLAPMPTSPSTMASASSIAIRGGDLATRGPERLQRNGFGVAGEDGDDSRPAVPQPGTGPERVSAVVAPADEQHDAGAVDVRQLLRHRDGEGGGRTGHQRHPCGKQRPFRRTDLIGGVGVPHDSATTKAVAIPASCVSERCQDEIPCAAAAFATSPCSSSTGRPSGCETTSASTHGKSGRARGPWRRPPWPRTARPATPVR